MRTQFKKYFIPHEKNDYKPHILQSISLGVMFLLIVISFTVTNVHSLLWINSDWLVSTILPAVVVELTNEERQGSELGTLRRNPILDTAAKLKADDMAKYSYFAHYSPMGVSPWYWFDLEGYNFIHAGENLAVHFTDSSEIVTAWMNSPGHRANILNGNYTEIGVGTAKGEYKGFPTVFVVQLFGTPARAAIPRTVTQTQTSTAPMPQPDRNLTIERVLGEETNSVNKPSPETTVAKTGTEETTVVEKPIPKQQEDETVEPVVVEPVPEVFVSPVITQETSEDEFEPIVDDTETYKNASVVIESDLATTSREGIPATTNMSDLLPPASGEGIPMLARGATQPKLWLQIVYSVLTFFVVVSLLMSLLIEWRRQHPIQIVYGSGLLVLMALLFYMHSLLTGGVTIV
jgi:hypothetical protein